MHLPHLQAACKRSYTALRIMSPQKILFVQLVEGICLCENMQITTAEAEPANTTPPDLTKHHLQKLSAVSPLTHTHTPAVSNSTVISHLFKTPNTFAHIFTDVCFHQPQQGGQVEQSGIQTDNPTIREISVGAVLLRSASAQNDWLTAVGLVSPLPQTIWGASSTKSRFKTTYFTHRYFTEAYMSI